MGLYFSTGNAKLNKETLIFNLPAGKTCPGAKYCRSMAVETPGGRKIKDGPDTIFRCFAASAEVQYDQVFKNRAENYYQIVEHIKKGDLTQFIDQELKKNLKDKHKRVRIHESGDFFNSEYLASWIGVSNLNPSISFYCFSKSLDLFEGLDLPSNFYMTASYGGKFDHLIDAGNFPRYAKVVESVEVANSLNLPIDVDDRYCFSEGPFAILVHGTQPKGSDMGKFARINRDVEKELRKSSI